MPCAPIDVDTDTYLSAGDLFLDVNGAVCDVVASAASAAGAGDGMAGTDSGGVDWATAYDDAATSALSTGATLADSLGHVGTLPGTCGDNHAGADSSSVPGGPPAYPGTGGGRGAASVLPATPPSADGTPDDPPPGWSLIAHLLEYTWPNGHQDRLHAVAGGWRTASTALDAEADRLSRAIGDISMLSSPEVDAAVTTCCDVQQSVRGVAAAYLTLAATCDDYATHLDEAHSEILRELAEFVAESAAIQALSAAASIPSAGSSEVAGQAGQAARALLAATRIDRVLEKLTAAVRVITTAVRAAFTRLAEVLVKLKVVLAKGATRAIETLTKPIQNTASQELARLFTIGTPRASQLRALAKREGWVLRQTRTGPAQYFDQNGVLRMTIKAGSARTPGSELPHVEIRNPTGARINPRTGLPATRRSPDNHFPIVLD